MPLQLDSPEVELLFDRYLEAERFYKACSLRSHQRKNFGGQLAALGTALHIVTGCDMLDLLPIMREFEKNGHFRPVQSASADGDSAERRAGSTSD